MTETPALFLIGPPLVPLDGLVEALGDRCVVSTCEPREALARVASGERPAAVILAGDGDLSRLEVLRGLQALLGPASPASLVLVEPEREDLLTKALEAGAADALLVPCRPADLQARLLARLRQPRGAQKSEPFTARAFAAASARPEHARPGFVFGDRVLLAELGGVGITRVFKAVRFDGSLAAIKLLDPEVSSQDVDWSRRFAREQRILQGIEHDNLVRVRAGGDLDGIPFLDMDFYQGETLDQVIDRLGQVAEAVSLDVAIQVARALEVLHERNIIHRDVKPENILVDPLGRVRVCDFGLSKPQDDAGLTHEGEILGTVAFIAPETLTGETAGFASDIYALGVTLFEMLTGEDAIEPGPTQVMFQNSLRGTAQSRALRLLNGRLRPVVSRMLAVAPGDRYASTHDLLVDLERLKAN